MTTCSSRSPNRSLGCSRSSQRARSSSLLISTAFILQQSSEAFGSFHILNFPLASPRFANSIAAARTKNQEGNVESFTTVATCDGPFSAELFAETHCWGRRPVLIRKAFDADSLLQSSAWPSLEEISDLAWEDDAEARIIRHVPGDLTSFSIEVGPFSEEALEDVMNEPLDHEKNSETWTLLVNDVDRFCPSLSDWMDQTFEFIPRWRRDDAQISLAPKLGGIGPHVDNYDVFLIQTCGTRRWEVGKVPLNVEEEWNSLVEDISVRILKSYRPEDYEPYVLHPGDVLYLPPRVTHCGTAMSDDCMTLSVGCRAPSASDLVSRIAQHLVESAKESAVARYQDEDLLAEWMSSSKQTRDRRTLKGEITAKVKEQMKQLVLNAVGDVVQDDAQWDQLVGEVVTSATRPRDNYPAALDEDDASVEGVWGNAQEAVRTVLAGQGALFRAEGISFALSRLTDGPEKAVYRLFANGETFEMQTNDRDEMLFTIMASIVHEPVLTRDKLLLPDTEECRTMATQLLEQLVHKGLLYGSDEV